MKGFVVVNADAGRTLRRKPAALRAADVLDCSGGFHAGDTIHVVVRGGDGGQGVIATGIVRFDMAALNQLKPHAVDARSIAGAGDEAVVAIAGQDLQLLWRPGQ